MKVNIDCENLESIVETTLNNNIGEAINVAVSNIVRAKVEDCIKENTELSIENCISNYVRDYIENTKIQVGSSFDEGGVKEYTIKGYINKNISDFFDKHILTIEEKSRWGDKATRKVSMKEYIDSNLNVESLVKSHIDRMTSDVKNTVNSKIRSVLDNSVKESLTNNIFSVLSTTETYQKIANNLKLLGE